MEEKKWVKNCPTCGRLQTYNSYCAYRFAVRKNKICGKCSQKIVKEHQKLNRKPAPIYKRNCPICGIELIYTAKATLKRLTDRNSPCLRCAVQNSNKNRPKQIFTYETRKKLSEAGSGIRHHMYGKKHTPASKTKMRKSRIKYIEVRYNEGLPIYPNYNPSSISILEELAIELGITDLQHAENGGEFYIKELGYWVDGYSSEKNIVIEYDEKYHYDFDGVLREKDVYRQHEIENHLGCEFIRIKENKY